MRLRSSGVNPHSPTRAARATATSALTARNCGSMVVSRCTAASAQKASHPSNICSVASAGRSKANRVQEAITYERALVEPV